MEEGRFDHGGDVGIKGEVAFLNFVPKERGEIMTAFGAVPLPCLVTIVTTALFAQQL
ncbi:UNVERIFIED_CONTAM: hypothetical protein FKN15_069020 [Acipenser sinensis]